MGLFSFIAGIFAPAVKLVDEVHVSEEEKLKLRNELAKIQESAMSKMMELEKAAIDAQASVSVAEANSKHWLTANWRPLTSVTLVGLILAASFGWIVLDAKVYELATYFLGGYAGGRSLEKFGAALKLGK